ncbi:MAG: sulfurtransferase [Noviherbaspirillum sp.]|jgi:rhodanese-related sulfurtransferase|nr:sulfurtransferase [Noviherbaspirillum sp.]
MQTMTAPELAAWLADAARARPVLLDVREPWEFQTCHIEGSVPMPMNTVPARIEELEEDAPIVCICHHGGRSMQVAAFLERNGFSHITNLTGGVHAWALQVDSSMPTY